MDSKTSWCRHVHCETCYDRHCQAPLHVSLGCLVIKCHKNCGAAFHMCKEEEHHLLCPNETVPCLNSGFGCPLRLLRHSRARHLEVCPASVVSCSQEWNRWPVLETDRAFNKNISQNPVAVEHLDVATALRDQRLLFKSIKMKDVFPELVEEELASGHLASEPNGTADPSDGFTVNGRLGVEEKELSQQERNALASNREVNGIANYNSWEKIFNKEMDGCKQTVKNLNRSEGSGQMSESKPHRESRRHQESARSGDVSGFAPWDEGVLERLGREVDIGEYNMYLAHNGSMLINFGQLPACTPREKDFVYGKLEPIEVKTIRSFNMPTSFRAKRNPLKDPMKKDRIKHQSVDTADLDVSKENLSKCEDISTTLLCCLEKELKGHLISESKGTDGLYIDEGTQTYHLESALFEAEASLADLNRPNALYVSTGVESVTRRHNRTSSCFSFMCGLIFRRDEFHSHFRNVHCDIQSGLSGWFQQRCPLAYLGCTFAQTRLKPGGPPATVRYSEEVSSFFLQPSVQSFFSEQEENPQRNLLGHLPLEILQHIAGYLDSFTLSQLSLVSRLMREVCATLLQDRGMVSLKWEKKTYSHGGSSWKCRKKVWQFSSVFTQVDSWVFSDTPSMSDHLGTCSFYQREQRQEPVALPCLPDVSTARGHAESVGGRRQ
ncbi:F-box only protein 40 [Synchiropus splendidus]|uniref:F-box only protein 40 n=1 Tax=Synchiropus splendidus TaxID=270530 RepID=UPI00237ED83A|nr:F-box only protein 40 [Synchiropus splendidus]